MTSDDEQKAIEEAFVQSWNRMEQFFKTHSTFKNYEWLVSMLDLIADLRKHGYDSQFRAGQSMDWFILSRSYEHGMRNEQARIGFALYPEGGMRVTYFEGSGSATELELNQVALTPEIETLLTRLLAQPID